MAFASCGSNMNSIGDPHFDSEGHLIVDSTATQVMELQKPSRIKFFVEVSGSMNGFFRPNRPTHFKADVWTVLSYFSAIAPDITILTNDGNQGASIKQQDFQTMLNTGQFISSASTKVPVMLQSIINGLDADAGEVAVLISDMKYSPVGNAAPAVLMTQYSTDVSKILGAYGKAVSLICATSDYVDRSGNTVCERSPYYFLLLGKQECVAEIRNCISTLLDHKNHFVDNIESGFDYGGVNYSFGISDLCEQLDDEPTFYNYEEANDEDTCTIKIKMQLENYRWILANKEVFEQCFTAKALHGSEVSVGDVEINVQNTNNRVLDRQATATIKLKVFNMPMDNDVVEWQLQLPDLNIALLNEFLDGATNENDVSKSYSVEDFIRGMFYGGVVNCELKPNYILVTKNS